MAGKYLAWCAGHNLPLPKDAAPIAPEPQQRNGTAGFGDANAEMFGWDRSAKRPSPPGSTQSTVERNLRSLTGHNGPFPERILPQRAASLQTEPQTPFLREPKTKETITVPGVYVVSGGRPI